MKVLILDNYDSFTYNLFHYVQAFTDNVSVKRNDELSVNEVDNYTHIIISPGPGLPSQAGISQTLLKKYYSVKNILGVCLGCQALAEFFGGSLYNQNEVAHGIERKIVRTKADSWLLKDLPSAFTVGLYHSWAIDPAKLPSEINVTALSEKGIVMAIEHAYLPLAGVQFHPESIMSDYGKKIVKNWLYR